eukprot:5876071-Pyramimonas_sp.AAC.1
MTAGQALRASSHVFRASVSKKKRGGDDSLTATAAGPPGAPGPRTTDWEMTTGPGATRLRSTRLTGTAPAMLKKRSYGPASFDPTVKNQLMMGTPASSSSW